MSPASANPAAPSPVAATTGATRLGASRRAAGGRIRRPAVALGPAVLALVVAAVLVPAYRYGVGIDGLSYLSIAEAYAEGDWSRALNAYWSPLFSWLLAPLLLVGVEPLLAASVLAALFAAGAVLAVQHLITSLGAAPGAAALTALAATPFAVYAAHYGVFADLLLAALLLAYCAEVVHPRFGRDPIVAVRAGIWIGLAYLAKLYALPFVAVHLPLAVALAWWAVGRGRRRRLLAHAGLAVAVAAAIALPWVVAISLSVGGPTFGTSGSYNVAIVAPDSQGNPIRYGGLLAPPADGSFSAWEDPSTMPVETGSWTESERASAVRLWDNITRNLEQGWADLTGQAGWLLPLGVAAFALLLVSPRPSTRPRLLVLAAAAGVYSGGYLVTWVEERYLWFLVLLLFVPVGLVVHRLATSARGGAKRRSLQSTERPVEPSASLARRQVAPDGRGPSAPVLSWIGALAGAAVAFVAIWSPAYDGLALRWDSGRELAGIIAEVERQGLVTAGSDVASADNWQRSAILCFKLGCRYWGHPASDDPARELADARISRYLVWSGNAEAPPELEPLAGGDDALGGLRVYAVP